MKTCVLVLVGLSLWSAPLAIAQVGIDADLEKFWTLEITEYLPAVMSSDCSDLTKAGVGGHDCRRESLKIREFSRGEMSGLPARVISVEFPRTRGGATVLYLLNAYRKIADGDYSNPLAARTLLSKGGDFAWVVCTAGGSSLCSMTPEVPGQPLQAVAAAWGYTGRMP